MTFEIKIMSVLYYDCTTIKYNRCWVCSLKTLPQSIR